MEAKAKYYERPWLKFYPEGVPFGQNATTSQVMPVINDDSAIGSEDEIMIREIEANIKSEANL